MEHMIPVLKKMLCIPPVIVEYIKTFEDIPLTMVTIEANVRLLSHPSSSDRQITVRAGKSIFLKMIFADQALKN